MMRLGAHESIAGGLHRAFERGAAVGCESLQIWTKNSRQWDAPPLTEDELAQFKRAQAKTGIHPVIAHAAYLINIASPNPRLWKRSITSLTAEAQRCEALGIPYLVLHPGAHTGAGVEAGLVHAVEALIKVQTALQGYRVQILLETTAGQGTALGDTFEQLAELLARASDGIHLGVCLDTCHVFAAGYDLRTPEGYAAMMETFDATIGLPQLHVVHLNDSRHPLNSHRDRHAHIGEGHLGLEGFRPILTDPRLDQLPGIIETPKSSDLHEDRENLSRLRQIARGKRMPNAQRESELPPASRHKEN